jgi:hypothetical protein
MSSNFDLFGPDIEISLDEPDHDEEEEEETRADAADVDDRRDDHHSSTTHTDLASRRPLKPLLADARPDWRALQVRVDQLDRCDPFATFNKEGKKEKKLLTFFSFSLC